MFIPLHDANPIEHIGRPFVTWGLIAATVLFFAVFQSGTVLPEEVFQAANLGLGYIPSVVNDIAELPPGYAIVPEDLTLITYQFLHVSWWHLGSNMLFLFVFGDNVEDAMGHWRFLVFYLVCGAAGAWLHGFVLPDSQAPLIGASGAVAGVVAAYLMLHPRVKIWVLALGRIPLRLPALWVLGFWAGLQFFNAFAHETPEVAWWAHVGGLLAGAALILVLRRRGVYLFDRNLDPIPDPS